MNYKNIKLNFFKRILICSILSFVLNTLQFYFLKNILSQKDYIFDIELEYSSDSVLLIYYDVGDGYNEENKVYSFVKKGKNELSLPFSLKQTDHLKRIRLDFGWDNVLEEVSIEDFSLVTNKKKIFSFNKNELIEHIYMVNHIFKISEDSGYFCLDNSRKKFDPHIELTPINNLVYPKWLFVLLLITPWITLFFLPVIKWFKQIIKNKEYQLLLISLFIASITLKTAWVTFITILLLVLALFELYKKKAIRFSIGGIAIITFFIISFIFLRHMDFSVLDKSLGFVLFPVIFSIIDFSKKLDSVQKIYIDIFSVLMSISIVSWITLMLYSGYYHKIDIFNYFIEIKSHAHTMMFWLYYEHTTFLSFFILIGAIFCQSLYRKGLIEKNYAATYGVSSFCVIVLLGSRFAFLIFIFLPIFNYITIRNIVRWAIPFFVIIACFMVYFINYFDTQRAQLWKTSWLSFKDRVWFGYGTGTSESILQNIKLAKKAGFNDVLAFNHSHNQYLTYLLETGVLGTFMFLISMFYILKRFIRDDNKSMVIISILILVLMIIESPFETATPLYTISFLLSIFLSERKENTMKS